MALYHCIVCNRMNISIEDLHNHHIQHHTPEELSHTIIHLQGLEKHFKPIVLGDSNNNKCTGDKITNYGPELTLDHDKKLCLLNCSQFTVWEHELNRRTEIRDEDFYNVIEMLCNDLRQKKYKGRKRKSEATTSKIKAKAFEYENKIYTNSELKSTKAKTENENIYNDFASQTCTPIISSWNTDNSIDNTIVGYEIPKSQIENAISIENYVTTFTLPETNTTENIFTYHLLDYKFP